MIEKRDFPTMIDAAHALADELAAALREGIETWGRGLLAVSGGRTPRHVFERLRELEVDWSKVTVTLIDERWVAPDHPESNELLVRTHLLQGVAAAAEFVPLYGGEDTPQTGQAACEARMQTLQLPFDAVYLGMGDDGHIASLFPGDPAVEVRAGRCVAVAPSGSRLPRMSLTAPTLLEAGKVFLLFNGADKHAKYAAARQPGSPAEIPLRLVLAQNRTPVIVLSAP